ncbi:MAG: HD domain-containing phosphohydrolase [Spirochaetia bacterium]|jgi:HD-GYP domain-containing protein (c-di-GMP phosphodiesterase class II)
MRVRNHLRLKEYGDFLASLNNVLETKVQERTVQLKEGALIALTHHECWDGSGYPSGIKGEKIPMPGRMMLLCDQYDALRGQRPYKPPIEHRAVVKILTEGDGRTRPEQFCPEVLDAFVSCKDDFQRIYSVSAASIAGSLQI